MINQLFDTCTMRSLERRDESLRGSIRQDLWSEMMWSSELEQVAKQLFPSSHAKRAFCNNTHSFSIQRPFTTMSTDPRRRAQPPPPPPPPEDVPDTTTMGVDGTTEQPSQTNGQQQPNSQAPANQTDDGGFKLKFCTVCASNNNRYTAPRSLSFPQPH